MIQDSSLYRSILRDWILISRFSYHPTVIQDERSSKKELILKNVPFHTGENRERKRERECLSFQISYLGGTRSKPDGQGFFSFVETRFKFHGF